MSLSISSTDLVLKSLPPNKIQIYLKLATEGNNSGKCDRRRPPFLLHSLIPTLPLEVVQLVILLPPCDAPFLKQHKAHLKQKIKQKIYGQGQETRPKTTKRKKNIKKSRPLSNLLFDEK